MALDPSYILQMTPVQAQTQVAQLQGRQIQNAEGIQDIQQNAQMNPLKVQQAQQDLASGKLDMLQKKNNMISQVLYGVVDEPSYQRALQWAQSNGLDTSRLPPNYDPQVVQQMRMGSLTASQYIQDQIKIAQLGLNGAKVYGGGYQNPMGGSPIAPQSSPQMGPPAPAQNPNMQGPPMPQQMGAQPPQLQPQPMQTLAQQKMAMQQQQMGQMNNYRQERLDQNQQRIDILKGNLSPQDEETAAQQMANGSIPVPNFGQLKNNPQGQRIFARAMQINPQLSSNDTSNLKYWDTGKGGQTVRSFNATTEHLALLDPIIDALGNGDVRAFNIAGNAWEKQTGGTAPANFDAIKGIVADELTKAILGSGGALGDREAMAATLDKANSPQQLKQVVQTYEGLMGGQLVASQKQYQVSTQRNDFASRLTPAAQNLFKGALGTAGGGQGGSVQPPPGAVPTGKTIGGKPVYKLPNGQGWMPD